MQQSNLQDCHWDESVAARASIATCASFDDNDEAKTAFDISDDATAASAPYSTIILAAGGNEGLSVSL